MRIDQQPLREGADRVVLGVRSECCCVPASSGRLDDGFADESRLDELPPELADVLSATEWASIVDALRDATAWGGAPAGPCFWVFAMCGLSPRGFGVEGLAVALDARFEGRGLKFSRGGLRPPPPASSTKRAGAGAASVARAGKKRDSRDASTVVGDGTSARDASSKS